MSLSLSWQWLKAAFPPPRTKWTPDDIPDLSAKVALVTGANTGIGREIVAALLRKNARVYLAARSPEKAQKAIDVLAKETGKTALYLKLDLSDLAAVRVSARELLGRESHIDLLFFNAGIMCPPIDQLTAQQYDLTFGTNVIGHHLFLRLTYPLLLSPPSSSPAGPHSPDPARIVWLSSPANYLSPGGRIDLTTLTGDSLKRRKLGPFAIYSQSKLATIALSAYVAKHAVDRGESVVSVAVDPGHTHSEIFHRDKAWYWSLWEYLVAYPTPYGAITPLYAGTAPEAVAFNGKYLRPWARIGHPNPAAYDAEEQQKVWDWLEKQVEPYM